MIVTGDDFRRRAAVRHLQHGAPAVRNRFVRAENAEVACVGVELEHVADKLTLHARRLGLHDAGPRHLDRVVAEVRHFQIPKQQPAVGMRIRSHSPLAFRSQFSQFREEPAVLVE